MGAAGRVREAAGEALTMPRLEACYFPDAYGSRDWARLAGVLEATAAEHCGSWPRRIAAISRAPARGGTGVTTHLANTHKLDVWCDRVDQAADGDELLLIDADVMILRPLDDVWTVPFDLAYTVRDYALPFNLGVIFARVTPATRRFFRLWHAENLRIFRPGDEAAAWRRRFGGVNQAAFGRLLERGELNGLAIRALPCREWNCEVSSWRQFDPDVTRIVHINGQLRRQVFHRDRMPAFQDLVSRWRAIDRAVHRGSRTA